MVQRDNQTHVFHKYISDFIKIKVSNQSLTQIEEASIETPKSFVLASEQKRSNYSEKWEDE